MQRSISHQKPIAPFFYVLIYLLYSSLGSIYPFVPPLLSILFILFSRALQRDDTTALLMVSASLLVFEVNYGYWLFSSIIYFYIQHKIIMPKIVQIFSCNSCIKISYVIFSYIGYFVFLSLVSNIFLLDSPEMSYYIIYYIVIEFFIVSLL
jgi:hypothetical protein